MDAFGVRLDGRGVAGDDAPSDAPSGDKIIFRHAAEGDAGHVGRDRGEGDVRRVFQNQLVVDFVGEDDKVVAACEFGDLLEHLARAQRARRIIRIDQYDGAGAWRELAFDVGEFGLPGVVFVEIVSIDCDPQLAQDGRVERVVGLRRENVFAGIHQRGDA